ncbi:MAG: LysM peptidoglycan-binding domain-containing protein [Opitutales bacterium]|nr:LysM peptidoglycan-binding domain-containing protein [Opitutales bacterium]
MENSSIDGTIEPVNTESKIPMILAIAAFVLGGLSFVFAWNTKSNLTRHKDSIIKEVNDAVEVAKQAAADARNAGAGSDGISTLQTDFEELEAMVKAEYSKLSGVIKNLVEHGTQTNKRLDRLEGRTSGPARGTTTTAATPASADPAPATAPVSSDGKYVVKKGDYPGKIAKELGVSTKALMDANPGLDPTKLQIGQELNVPANQ